MSTNDHRIKIGSGIRGLQLIRDDRGTALYNVTEDIPNYQPQLRFRQNDWLGGHGQYDFTRGDMYFEGQSIDTTQEGRIILGPLINSVGISGGTLGANPVCFCWFNTISKWMVATATRVFWYDGTNFVMKWDRANHDWTASHAFTTADWCRPTTYNGHIYECTTAGTSGGTEPTWGTTDAGTTADGGAVWTCRSITITDLVDIDDILYVSLGSSALYYYSSNGADYTVTDLTDGYAEKIFASPNPAAVATVLWKWKDPNELSYTTDGRTVAGGGAQWSSPAYIGDTSNDITNILLVNDNLMIGKEDNLWHYDSDGGTHPLMNDLKHNRSATNFKYVTEWQTGTYFSLVTGIGEITSYNSYDNVGPLKDTGDLDKVGTCVGLASDTGYMYPAMDEGTNTIIYKGREVSKGGALRWEWCPFVFLSTNACATAKICQHSATDRRLWFGYGNYAGYVILSDNPTADSAARFATSGWIRMSYVYGTDKYWDKLFQSIVTETKSCASGKTVTPKYRKDTDTTATVLAPAITTNGIVNTNLGNEIDCKRIQFELHLATNASTATPEVLYFEARGIEKPETVRVHEATYAIGDTPSKRAKTIRDFLRSARTSEKLIKFADLRYGQSIDKDYTWVVMQPGYPREVEVAHEKGRQPQLGLQCRWQEVAFG